MFKYGSLDLNSAHVKFTKRHHIEAICPMHDSNKFVFSIVAIAVAAAIVIVVIDVDIVCTISALAC